MKHIEIIPDCPECGHELIGHHSVTHYDCTRPFSGTIDGWWECDECGYQSEHKPIRPYEDETMYRRYTEKLTPSSAPRGAVSV